VNAPIGIFDSGIGGLTVAKALVERLPRESLYYVGDTAHMPYGDKSVDSLKEYAAGISKRFVDAGCKAVVVACNSASSNALDTVKAAMGAHVPVIDVVQPVVNWVAQYYSGKQVALVGTRATVDSGIYQAKLAEANVGTKVRATPLLASAIEEGFHNGTISEAVVNAYFADQWTAGTTALILACTHYPLAMDKIIEMLNEPLNVVDGPAIVADALAEALAHLGLGAPEDSSLGRHRFEVTDWTGSFAQGAKHIMQSDLNLQEVGWTSP
jgi:glutamate racemase